MKNKSLGLISLCVLSILGPLANARNVSTPSVNPEFNIPHVENPGLFWWGYQDSGLVLGRVVNFESRGYLVKNWEFVFNFGDLGDGVISKDESTDANINLMANQNAYYGVPYTYSTLNSDVYKAAMAVDPNKPVVLKYEKSVRRWNPMTRETRFNIVGIYPTYLGSNSSSAGLAPNFEEKNRLPLLSYRTAKATGRIIKVQRWGTFSTGCAITLHKKGVKTVSKRKKVRKEIIDVGGGVGVGGGVTSLPDAKAGAGVSGKVRWEWAPYTVAVMNVEKLKMNSDEGCRYAEDVLVFGKTVNIEYKEAMTGVFDFPKVVKSIHIND